MAQAVGAKLTGDWQGCHSTAWDANAPNDSGDRELSNQFTKSGYPLGIMVNAKGERFVDEGQDFRNYTYAKFGRAILEQPGGYAFQIYDMKTSGWLRQEEYGDGIVEKISSESMEELADKLVGRGLEDGEAFVYNVSVFNEAVRHYRGEHPDKRWDPSTKDGLSTQSSLALPKSNWALAIDQAPFMGIKVACGITFTFGGLAIDPETAEVLSETTGRRIPGLFCAGEMVGGLVSLLFIILLFYYFISCLNLFIVLFELPGREWADSGCCVWKEGWSSRGAATSWLYALKPKQVQSM
jgi:hypothetical protein